jgi:hypothetical protein
MTTQPVFLSNTLAKRSLLVITALVFAMAVLIANLFGINKTVTYNDSECELLPNIGPGSEDIAVVDNNLALVSAGDLDRIHLHSGKAPREAGMFAIHFLENENQEKMHTEKITILGFPEGETFNPHGIHYSNQTQRVYAVSHACGDRVSEAIEIFQLVRNEGDKYDGDKDPDTPSVKLVYERSIKSKLFPLGAMNNVVEGAFLGEVYITQWLPGPMSEKCKGHGNPIEEIKLTMNMLMRKMAKVHRCVWDPNRPKQEATCTVVADGFRIANGITSNPERKQIYVLDAGDLNNALYIFDREEDGSLSLNDHVHVPHSGDNVEFDFASRKLTMSGWNPVSAPTSEQTQW